MTNQIPVFAQARLAGSTSPLVAGSRSQLFTLLALSAWCGLVSGLLEGATIVLRKRLFDSNHLYEMTRHFVWLIPVTNLSIFLALGVVSCVAALAWPRRIYWLAPRLLCALTILPPLMVAFPRIYGPAWLAVALGIATRLVPALESRAGGFRRVVRASFPAMAGLVSILAFCIWGADRIKEWREERRPLPPPGSPNVLLIVLDTVAADHLSLYGYDRPTSPTLDELARAGIRFDSTHAASSWTLPSHASMFTGRWPHELSAGWLTPLDGAYPTLAEFLSSRGYATAGFVANYSYCALDSGLGRGFATYRDYMFPGLSAFKSTALVERLVSGLEAAERFAEDWLDFDLLKPAVRRLWLLFNGHRKGAAVINRQFLGWLSHRRQPERPFFGFLNYFDAHWPYEIRNKGIHRFGLGPRDNRESDLIHDWWTLDKRGLSTEEVAFVRNSYDDCVADLDEQLGRLTDELLRGGVIDHTWVFLTADHGESFGEHAGVYCHGTSLYQTELHVPLVILPPAGTTLSQRVIKETVSLRDLAATIVDIAGLETGSPFPGESFARFWGQSRASASSVSVAGPGRALAEVVPNDPLADPGRSPRPNPNWPLGALVEERWSYIRREGGLHEELFNLRDDAKEAHNLAGNPDARRRLEQMRGTLRQLTAGPLTPERFQP